MKIPYNVKTYFEIDKRLEKLGLKHLVLESTQEIAVLGKCPNIRIGSRTYEGSVFHNYPPRENLMFSATIIKQLPMLIDRMLDLSRVVDDKDVLDNIKMVIKYADKLVCSFQNLLKSLNSPSSEV